MNAKDLISLIEKSYSETDIPKLFRVIFDLKRASKDLVRGVLPGVSGISDTKEIVMEFLGVARDSMLIMPAVETEKINKLSRIMYDNPQYLLQDNMSALARLYATKPGNYNIIQNLLGYMIKYTWGKNPKYAVQAHDAEYFGWESRLGFMFKDEFPEINGSRDLAKWVVKATKRLHEDKPDIRYLLKSIMGFTVRDIEGFILEALKYINKTYKSEGEWILKDSILKIPKKSKLLVLKNDPFINIVGFMLDVKSGKIEIPKYVPEKEKYDWYLANNSPQVKLIEKYKLDKRYKVIYVTAKEFNGIKKRYFSRKYPD